MTDDGEEENQLLIKQHVLNKCDCLFMEENGIFTSVSLG